MNPGGWPSTLFTAGPQWHWLIVGYFFVGGLAGGCYFLAALIDLFGGPEDRPLARLGYYVAFPAVVLSGIFLTFDLGRPLRFWHMLVESNTGRPMFKAYSPMSVGSWALLLFGAFALVAFLAALAEAGRLERWPWLRRFRPTGVVGGLVAIVGGLVAFFVAGYTGVLLTVTNRPIWADTTLLGLNFLVSAASTSAALLVLLAGRRWRATAGVQALERFDAWVLVLELLALVGLLVSLGSMLQAWLNAWGALLVGGVIVVGILIPLLLLHWRPRLLGRSRSAAVGAFLVLVGGFVFRVVVIFSSDGIRSPM
jgi:formate-dependent nitrite reductase membrane component NrfD